MMQDGTSIGIQGIAMEKLNVDLTVETYSRAGSAVFNRTKEKWGEFSNMCAGFPLRVNGVDIRTSEALYQAMRFPDHPEVQQQIFDEPSPKGAKMKSKRHRKELGRQDWDEIQMAVMWWCQTVKLAQNFDNFGGVLFITGNKPIVEESANDMFWGAKDQGNGTLKGANVLGKLLMELRSRYLADRASLKVVEPPGIANFQLMGQDIGTITAP
jgi:ribA/ribD-fused uncharacterized protein